MSEDRTQNLPNDELRQILTQLTSINARLDSVDSRLDSVDSRLDGMDSRLGRLEARDHDTKPIWENALKEITDTRAEMREGFTKVDAEFTKVHAGMDNLRAEMDAGLRKVARQIDALNNNILGVQVELRGLDAIVSRLETQAAQ
jgi:predicted  nucleic acid-binding Zn-ribbon protein